MQFTGEVVGSLVSAAATHAVPDRESGFAFIATSLSPCHLRRRFSLNKRPRDSSIHHFRLCGRRFALVVFRLVRLRIVPFSVPCCPSYFSFFRLPTSFADLAFAMNGFGRQFPVCANISKRHLKNTKQTSRTSHRTNISNT